MSIIGESPHFAKASERRKKNENRNQLKLIVMRGLFIVVFSKFYILAPEVTK